MVRSSIYLHAHTYIKQKTHEISFCIAQWDKGRVNNIPLSKRNDQGKMT